VINNNWYGIHGCFPTQSGQDGGSHIGLIQISTTMTDAYDWAQNIQDGIDLFDTKMSEAGQHEANLRHTYPNLGVLSTVQKEKDALFRYGPFAGTGSSLGWYWVPNSAKNAWIKNTGNPNGTGYVDDVLGKVGTH
jgi:hypothetical protein